MKAGEYYDSMVAVSGEKTGLETDARCVTQVMHCTLQSGRQHAPSLHPSAHSERPPGPFPRASWLTKLSLSTHMHGHSSPFPAGARWLVPPRHPCFPGCVSHLCVGLCIFLCCLLQLNVVDLDAEQRVAEGSVVPAHTNSQESTVTMCAKLMSQTAPLHTSCRHTSCRHTSCRHTRMQRKYRRKHLDNTTTVAKTARHGVFEAKTERQDNVAPIPSTPPEGVVAMTTPT